MAVSLVTCSNSHEVLEKLRAQIDERAELLPKNPDASIIIKPNLNSNLDALTGNTTDLRVLCSILQILTERGYKNISILEGPNGGYHRDGIDVFSRNRIDALAMNYGCTFRDVNYETNTATVGFAGSEKVQIARSFKECDLFINVPKLKTHYETLISVALKSLIGIAVGQPNKAKAHASLCENILRLNDEVRADIYIVDGLIAMQGNGPSAGEPVRLDIIMIGDDPYEIDVTACLVMGFEPEECPLIDTAIKTGRISRSVIENSRSIGLALGTKPFAKPKPAFLAKLVAVPKISGLVRTVRNCPPVSRLLKSTVVRRLLFILGLTQEVLINKEKDVRLTWHKDKCEFCRKCSKYCPRMLELPEAFHAKNNDCLNCLYCYAVCPNNAITITGQLGYYEEQIRRYGKMIKRIA